MKDQPSTKAWNNFVMRSMPESCEAGSIMRSAAISSLYMGLANNGGINSFLTDSYELDASEVLEALVSIGAVKAAEEFRNLLSNLGVHLPVSSQEARWHLLEQHWSDELDEQDILSKEADAELLGALERHVREHEPFYLALE